MAKKKSINPKPDSSYTEENGGYNFTAWGIHVIAKNIDEAKEHILAFYGVDVDKDIPPVLPEREDA